MLVGWLQHNMLSNKKYYIKERVENSSAVALIATIFVSKIEQKQSIFCLNSKSLNFNLLFIEILLYKISVTVLILLFGETHGYLMLLT